MQVSTYDFTYNKTRNQFTADISDLGRSFTFERIYSDACDVGLILVSEKTGNSVAFSLDEEVEDGEGGTTYWKLSSNSRKPILRDMTMIIFND